MKTQQKTKKKLSVRGKALIVALISAIIIGTIWAAFSDVIVLRKTEDMTGSENAISILFVGDSFVFVGELPKDNLYKGNDAIDLAQAAWEFVNQKS